MNCKLCDQTIKDYNSSFHHLKIDGSNGVDICPDCIDKFVKWQGNLLADLFPTGAMRRRFRK